MLRRLRVPPWAAPAVLVAVGAAVFRLAVDLRSGGLAGAGSVDDGVHYTAAASLLAGRLPYRDFLFLHPPGIVLLLVPFAALARLIGDAHAFELARLAGILLGAVNAGLVVVALRRFGRAAALTGGAAYACCWPAVFAERSALLEPVGCFLLLVACSLTVGEPDRQRTLLAGAALGGMAVVKLAFLPSALVVLLALGRRAPRAGAAGAAVAGLVALPFFAAAPTAMWRQIVLDQLGRPRIVPLIGLRLAGIVPPPAIPGIPQRDALAAALGLAAVLVAIGLCTPGARRYAMLALVEFPLLLAGPSFYGHYAVLVALPLALLAGVAVGRLRTVVGERSRWRRMRDPATAVALLVLLVAIGGAWTPTRLAALSTSALPRGLVDALGSTPGCAIADNSTTLALAGLVTRDLERRCTLWPDVNGLQYERTGPGPTPPAWRNPSYQRRTAAYLRSGAVVVLTKRSNALPPTVRAALRSGPTLWSGPAGSVHLTPDHRAS